MEIIPGVFQEKTGISNWYLLVEEAGLTLIDAGVKSATQPVLDLIQSLGRTPSDLTKILITHADIDHVGAAMRCAPGPTRSATTG